MPDRNTEYSRVYRPDIDGLRALAVFSVIAFHVGIPWFSGGFVGVDIFFVISGYLIGSIIYRQVLSGSFSFARFYARRAKRILPALLAVLLCCYVAASVLLTPGELQSFGKGAVATIAAVSNVDYWRNSGYFASTSALNPLLMTWSLGVEEQFYLFFPVVILFLYKFGGKRVVTGILIVSICSFVLSAVVTARAPGAAFFLLPTRAWELGVGTLLAVSEIRRPVLSTPSRGWLVETMGCAGLFLLGVGIFGYDSRIPFPGVFAAIPVAGAALVVAARNSLVNRLFSVKPVVFVGLVSYSWYLWHWPLLSFARIAANQDSGVGITASIALTAFVIAIVSWRFIEQPFRSAGGELMPGVILRRYAFATALVVIPAVMFAAGHGWPRRFPDQVDRIDRASLELQADPCLAIYGANLPDSQASCFETGRPQGVAIIGDSHAAALSKGLRVLAHRNGFDFSQITKVSCPPLVGVTRLMPNHPDQARDCPAFMSKGFELIRDTPEIRVVLITSYWSAPSEGEAEGDRFVRTGTTDSFISPAGSLNNLQAGLEMTVKLLHDAGKQVIVATDVPIYNFNPVRQVETTYMPARRALARFLSGRSESDNYYASKARVMNTQDAARKLILQVPAWNSTVRLLDLQKALCRENRCQFADEQGMYYVDFQHLSLAGAEHALAGLCLTETLQCQGNTGSYSGVQ